VESDVESLVLSEVESLVESDVESLVESDVESLVLSEVESLVLSAVESDVESLVPSESSPSPGSLSLAIIELVESAAADRGWAIDCPFEALWVVGDVISM
jgi:hypothetical protein